MSPIPAPPSDGHRAERGTDDADASGLPDVGALLAQARADTLVAFEPNRLCRLALLPEWTDTTAVLFGLVSPDGLARLVAELDDAGLIERRRTPGSRRTTRQVFWLRASRRDEVGRHLRNLGLDVDAEIDALSEVIAAAAEASPAAAEASGGAEASAAAGEVPAGELAREFAPWLEVAVQHRRDRSGSSLFRRVDSLVTAAGSGG
ncbi:hypothetical protein ND748_32435, partial [Frankia sp. AiPs1]|uniref:hypothetical protein n=1 Tax=Frankia sp. AiPs1 TaxID=573493 RepID=UPI00204320B1